jgi:hypothetical protein
MVIWMLVTGFWMRQWTKETYSDRIYRIARISLF